jgi:DNA-binding transcriptional MerR regulator
MQPLKEQKLTKLYYSIGEVAAFFQVNASLIRFWEKEFQVISPKKNRKGNRLFSPKDIENIEKIYQLVKVRGFTLEGAKNALKLKDEVILEIQKEKDKEKEEKTNNERVIAVLEKLKIRLLSCSIH